MYKGIIYKYTSPSNKNYIGQTTKTLSQRAGIQGENYKRCTVFYRAILKYGFSNFKVEILEIIEEEDLDDLIEKLNYKESYYIKKYNSLTPNGYNIREGGENNKFSKDSKVCQHGSKHYNYRIDLEDEKLIEMYKTGKTLKELSEITGISKETIKRHIKDKNELKEKKYNEEVVMIDKNFNILGEWKSASEAARVLGKSSSSISRSCCKKANFYKGITFRFKENL